MLGIDSRGDVYYRSSATRNPILFVLLALVVMIVVSLIDHYDWWFLGGYRILNVTFPK